MTVVVLYRQWRKFNIFLTKYRLINHLKVYGTKNGDFRIFCGCLSGRSKVVVIHDTVCRELLAVTQLVVANLRFNQLDC